MPNASNTDSDLAYADTLWKSADALRDQIDAVEYRRSAQKAAAQNSRRKT